MSRSTYISLLSHKVVFPCKVFSAAVSNNKIMSAPSIPNRWERLRQRIEEYKKLATEVTKKDAEHGDMDPDRTILPKLDDLGPQLDDEANWHTWDSRRFDNEIANVDGLIEAANKILGALKRKISEALRRKEESAAENWGRGFADAS